MTDQTQNENALEPLALELRRALDNLRAAATEAGRAVAEVKDAHLPALRAATAKAISTEAELISAVENSPPGWWSRARTRVAHGIRYGWQKQRGRVEIDDEAKVIERIRKQLPAAQAEILIRAREAVHKPAVYDLTAADLKRLGIRVTDDCDAVTVRDLQAEADRLVAALVDEARAALEAEKESS